MFRVVLFLAVAGCSFRAGKAGLGPGDGSVDDAPDAPVVDAPDARPIDAHPDAHPDAPRDAPPDAPPIPIAYVQGNYGDPVSFLTTLAVAYAQPQTAGNFNIVAVGWLDSGNTVASVVDSAGNTYTRIAHTVNTVGQDLFVAPAIAASASNTVTVTMTGSATYLDVRVAEYSGLATTNVVDQTVTGGGTGTAVDSGMATTTLAHELLFAACTVQHALTAGDPAYSVRILTNNDGNLIEDREVTATGSYHATATQNFSGAWVITLATLRAAN